MHEVEQEKHTMHALLHNDQTSVIWIFITRHFKDDCDWVNKICREEMTSQSVSQQAMQAVCGEN